ncbi:1171_t:CDS:2 [Acaulospora morrowiae]|uniref:1171_t:CDS:1 n=1 Tax=Acaulospora morrowiae TaxID=94023 RepID=A0A9N8YSK7_9GLOM|nr:1171_t:CDS:2 [Acaulospora morrowiae]
MSSEHETEEYMKSAVTNTDVSDGYSKETTYALIDEYETTKQGVELLLEISNNYENHFSLIKNHQMVVEREEIEPYLLAYGVVKDAQNFWDKVNLKKKLSISNDNSNGILTDNINREESCIDDENTSWNESSDKKEKTDENKEKWLVFFEENEKVTREVNKTEKKERAPEGQCGPIEVNTEEQDVMAMEEPSMTYKSQEKKEGKKEYLIVKTYDESDPSAEWYFDRPNPIEQLVKSRKMLTLLEEN